MSEEELKSQQKLQWLGLSEAAQSLSEIKLETNLLEDNLRYYEDFQNNLENGYDIDDDNEVEQIEDFTTFDSYLQEIGFTEGEADAFIEKIKNNFEDTDSSGSIFDEFKEYALNEAQEFSTLSTGFGSNTEYTGESETEEGVAAAGIKFHDSGGVTRNGVSVPPGSTEVFGREVHFSQSAPPSTEDTGSGSGINYSNIGYEPQFPTVGDSATVSVDVENTYSTEATVRIPFKEDGVVIDDKSITLPATGSTTVSFAVSQFEEGYWEYKIGNSDGVFIAWDPEEVGDTFDP